MEWQFVVLWQPMRFCASWLWHVWQRQREKRWLADDAVCPNAADVETRVDASQLFIRYEAYVEDTYKYIGVLCNILGKNRNTQCMIT